MPTRTRKTRPSPLDWFASLLFWACLVAAVGMYGATVLAPKVLAYLELDQVYRENQVRLVRVEKQVEYFDKVSGALESDPKFAAELARIEFDASRPGEEHIAVDQRLSLQAPASTAPLPQSQAALPWYTPMLRKFVDDDKRRNQMLGGSAALVIFAFTFLQDNSAPMRKHRPRRA